MNDYAERNRLVLQFIVLPTMLLTVVLLGGLRIDAETRHFVFIAPPLVTLVLAVLFLVGLIGTSVWVLRPFLGALAWATMIVVATWPLMLRVERAVGNRRWIAVTIMSLIPVLRMMAQFHRYGFENRSFD